VHWASDAVLHVWQQRSTVSGWALAYCTFYVSHVGVAVEPSLGMRRRHDTRLLPCVLCCLSPACMQL
jgi:hypothetical protein